MALILDGVDQRAIYDLPASETSAQDWFLFSMVNFATLDQGSNKTFFGVHYLSVAYRYLGIRFNDSTDTLETRFRAGSSSILANNATARSTNTWYRVAFRWDETNKNLYCYVDDETPVSATGDHLDNNMQRIVCGCSYSDGSQTPVDFLDGKMAYTAAWHGTIPSASGITDLMDGTKKPDAVAAAPDFYETLVGSAGAYTLQGTTTPTVDSEDPWGGAPASSNSKLLFNDMNKNGGMRL